MVHHLSIDLETYSSADIKKSGLYKYGAVDKHSTKAADYGIIEV